MNLDYTAIFAQRGHAYHGAMQRQPDARNAEFDQLFAHVGVIPGQTVLDIPAGGGYLARRLPKDVHVSELELSAGFTPDLRVVAADGDWGVGQFDHTVTLAGLHHIADQNGFIAHLARHTRKGGAIHIADVDKESWLHPFLDGFVGRYNITGHEGKYLTRESFTRIPGTTLIASEVRPCPWRFASREALLDFAADLFGLVKYPRAGLVRELAPHISESKSEAVLDWKLRYVDLEVI